MICDELRCNHLTRIPWCFLALFALTASDISVAEEARDGFESVEEQILGTRNWMVLGLGVGALPTFEGAEDYEERLVPLIDIRRGRFFAGMRNGIGVYIVDTPPHSNGCEYSLDEWL